jgi:DNA-binding NtrC family response regulator
MNELVTELHAARVPYDEAVSAFRKGFVLQALSLRNGHRSNTAGDLGVHRNTMTRMLGELAPELGPGRDGRRPVRSVCAIAAEVERHAG